MANPDVALAHDYLLVPRGAERTFAAMAECWPGAPIHTLLYDAEATGDRFGGRPVQTSPLQRLNASQGGFRRLLPLLPLAASRLVPGTARPGRLQQQRLRPRRQAAGKRGPRLLLPLPLPLRLARAPASTGGGPSLATAAAAGLTLALIRRWDLRAAARVSHYIANSRITQRRIAEFYGREAPIVHPPVAVHRFSRAEPEDYFVFVGEVTRHKRVELAIEAARKAEVALVVVGSGPDLERLRALHGDRVRFTGRVDDEELVGLVARARAQIVPNVEEFGIAAVEAQAAGRPVVAAAAGGAMETVVEGETGLLVEPDSVAAFAAALGDGEFERFDPVRIRANAERFSVPAFQAKLGAEVARLSGYTVPGPPAGTTAA